MYSMKKTNLLFFIALMAYSTLFAQDKEYLDELMKPTSEDSAKYYLLKDKDSLNIQKVEVFYLDGVLKERYYLKQGKIDGEVRSYHPNRQLRKKGNYKDGWNIGLWEEWLENGQKKEEIRHYSRDTVFMMQKNGIYYEGFMINAWDAQGIQMVKDGDGVYVRYFDDGQMDIKGTYKNFLKDGLWQSWYIDGKLYYTETFQEGKLTFGKSYDENGKEYHYSEEVEKIPVPIDGIKNLYKYINDNLKYPKQARRSGIEGKVLAGFVVNADGSIKDIKILKGIDNECDNEVLKLVSSPDFPKWVSGLRRGKPVDVNITLPIVFRLR